VSLVEQWNAIESALPGDWGDVDVRLAVADVDRAAALLGPLSPGLLGSELRLTVHRRRFPGPEAVDRLLRLLDEEGIDGRLELIDSAATPAGPPPEERPSLAEQWDAALTELPDDWSDLYVELELTSSDHLDPAALALAPVNPLRYGPEPGFRFRCARRFGYGVSPQMARRCLARVDEIGFPGELRVLRVLSDTRPVATQGPVWYVEGKVV
jgi:hypothetical protein